MEPLPPKGKPEQTVPQENASKTENDRIDTIAERVIAAFIKINRANRKADAAENERNHHREQRRFKVEILEIFLISVYAFFTILEWRTFNTESKIMAQEFAASQTNTVQQLSALQGQLDEMKMARQEDERAWVFVIIPDNALTFSGTNVNLAITDKNIGKTPGIITHVFGSLAIDPKQIPKRDPFGNKSSLMLIPNQQGVLAVNLPNIIGMGILQNVPIYVYGTVYYRDINRVDHWTQYCFRFDQNGRIMTPQDFHNSCDDLEGNQNP